MKILKSIPDKFNFPFHLKVWGIALKDLHFEIEDNIHFEFGLILHCYIYFEI